MTEFPLPIKQFSPKDFPLEYRAYCAAKHRCTNRKTPDYRYYGGRGIKFRFNSFAEFFNEVGRKPTPKHTIDRVNNNGHYEKGNLRWATRLEQANNLRKNRYITAFGKTLTIAEWTRQTGIKRRNITYRLDKGWCLNCVFTKIIETCTHEYNPYKNHKTIHRNRKNNRLITANGKTLTMVEWSEISGLKESAISNRLHIFGFCQSCAVTLPVKEKCPHRKIILLHS